MTDDADLRYELATHTLDNGLRVCVQPDPMAPAVAVNLWFEVGSRDEEPGRSGFAHLFEHLMFQGSADVASGEHIAVIEAAGGSVNATTSVDRTNYFETVPPGALDLALWLEANRMASLDVSTTNFEAQRDVVKEEKRQRYDNQPYGDLLELLVAQHFGPSHPYGHLPIGSMADLDAAGIDDVRRFFETWYLPSNARLVISGNVSTEEALALTETHFGGIPSRPSAVRGAAAGALPDQRSETVRRDVPHPLLYVSWPTPPAAHPDTVPLEVALGILTDGHASRLHKAMVRGQDVAEEVHGGILPHLGAPSITTILARPSEASSTQRLAEVLQDEVDKFARTGPDPEELARAKAQYEREWLQELATVEGRADAINDCWLTYGDPVAINHRLRQLGDVTPADISRVTSSYLAPPPNELHYLTTGADR